MYSPDLKEVSSEVVHENPWWSYKHDAYASPEGILGHYYYGETPGSGCSMVVPVLPDGKILLIRQYRYLRDKFSVEFPCGGLNKGEQPEEAARRELLEETGYAAGEVSKIGMYDSLSGLFKDTTHVFVSSDVSDSSESKKDPTENIEILFRRPDEFDDMIRRGEIWDGQTLASWALAREKVYQLLTR